MTFDANDPRLTAYALGELEGAELAEIEAMLAASPEGRRFVAETRETARLLTAQLHVEPSPGLAPEHHRAIEKTLNTNPAKGQKPMPVPQPEPGPARRWINPGRI